MKFKISMSPPSITFRQWFPPVNKQIKFCPRVFVFKMTSVKLHLPITTIYASYFVKCQEPNQERLGLHVYT